MSHVQKTVDEVANMYISRCFRHEIRYSIEFGQTMNWWIVFEQTQSVRRSSASRLSCKSIADRKQEAFALTVEKQNYITRQSGINKVNDASVCIKLLAFTQTQTCQADNGEGVNSLKNFTLFSPFRNRIFHLM